MSRTAETKRNRTANLALAIALSALLGMAPFAALADDSAAESAAGGAVPSGEAASSASAAADTNANSAPALKPEELYGLYAATGATTHGNEAAIATSADGASGLYAEADGVIVANTLSVQTTGKNSPAAATSPKGGSISLTNSELTTTGTSSALLQSAGIVEADNVAGTASASAIAQLNGADSTLIMRSCTFTSEETGKKSGSVSTAAATLATGGTPAAQLSACVRIYQTDEREAATSTTKTALFQADSSSLKSALEEGSLFLLSNTTADIILSDTELDFDDENVKLLVAEGDKAGEWGANGKNGATATMSAIDQKLRGDIEVDSISSLELFLLDGSKWSGSSGIVSNYAGTDLTSNIVVNIDATSGWTVTKNSTVSYLNIEKGGALVDEKGKAVAIADADGNTLVDGASEITVTVTGEFSTTVKTTKANALQPASIDRSAFDASYGTSTAFGTNGSNPTDEERAAALQQRVLAFFQNL